MKLSLPVLAQCFLLVAGFASHAADPSRWLGVALIVIGVGFVANGPSRTEHAPVEMEAIL